jgi:hypothetical protein
MNPAPSKYSIIEVKWFNQLNKEEGAGVNPAPSINSQFKVIGLNELNKKKVLDEYRE